MKVPHRGTVSEGAAKDSDDGVRLKHGGILQMTYF